MDARPRQGAVGNSGLFVWGDPLPAVGTAVHPRHRGAGARQPRVQGRLGYTSHGDVFSIWGATCKPDRPHPNGAERCLPSENRAKGGGEWNHYRVDRQRRRHQAARQRQGGLRRERSATRARATSPWRPKGPSATSATSRSRSCRPPTRSRRRWRRCAEGHKSLFNGLDLTGWKTENDTWKAAGGHLEAAGKADLIDRGEVRRRRADLRLEGAGEGAPARDGRDRRTKTATGVRRGKPGTWKRADRRRRTGSPPADRVQAGRRARTDERLRPRAEGGRSHERDDATDARS